MRWEIFCRVIDNHGDVGVCWRLACDLAGRGESVLLWIDDAAALSWMAPTGCDGVEVLPWSQEVLSTHGASQPAAHVLIEAFGCEPAPERIARFAADCGGVHEHRWINLEYLSAESAVERLHGLPSPVFHGAGKGLTRHFFYPGFTERTGGLLREPGLLARRERFDRAAWLQSRGVPWAGERVVCLFCYEPAALPELLAVLERGPSRTRLLVAAGCAEQALGAGPARRGALEIHPLPYLTQIEFDHLLWSGDLNFVRGEDSFVRALWAGAPMVWQIYPQDDLAHHAKLSAFLDWYRAPPSLRRLHQVWNGLEDASLVDVQDDHGDWAAAAHAARERARDQDDLSTRLMRFVAQKS